MIRRLRAWWRSLMEPRCLECGSPVQPPERFCNLLCEWQYND